jgi:hypothetical protein
MRSDPRHTRWQRVGSAWLTLALLAGCASKAPAPATAPPPSRAAWLSAHHHRRTRPWLAFQQQHRAAAAAEQRGQWTQVLWHLDVLLALAPAMPNCSAAAPRPNKPPSRRRRAQQRARQARARGDHESATRLYLELLSLAPGDAEAAEALRALERERVKRQHLGQLSRNTLTPSHGCGAHDAQPTTCPTLAAAERIATNWSMPACWPARVNSKARSRCSDR